MVCSFVVGVLLCGEIIMYGHYMLFCYLRSYFCMYLDAASAHNICN
jgi:hypothetical protein